MSKKKNQVSDVPISDTTDASLGFTLKDIEIDDIISTNYGIVQCVVPFCIARMPWPVAIVAWVVFAAFWLTVVWWLTILFELVLIVPRDIVRYVDYVKNRDPNLCHNSVITDLGNYLAGVLIMGIGRIVFCFYALSEGLFARSAYLADKQQP